METYPSDAEGRASFSSATERKSEEERGAEVVLRPEKSGSGCGVQRRSSGIGQRTRWSDSIAGARKRFAAAWR